jgi:hypothetical protein
MNSIKLRIFATIVPIIILDSATIEARTFHRSDLSRHALRIDSIAYELRNQIAIHYRHSCEFERLMRSTSRLIGMARHMHRASVHSPLSLSMVSSDLAKISQEANHINKVMEFSTCPSGRRYHPHARHVHQLRNHLNGAIHSMQNELRSIRIQHNRRNHHYRSRVVVERQVSPAVGILSLILSQL